MPRENRKYFVITIFLTFSIINIKNTLYLSTKIRRDLTKEAGDTTGAYIPHHRVLNRIEDIIKCKSYKQWGKMGEGGLRVSFLSSAKMKNIEKIKFWATEIQFMM